MRRRRYRPGAGTGPVPAGLGGEQLPMGCFGPGLVAELLGGDQMATAAAEAEARAGAMVALDGVPGTGRALGLDQDDGAEIEELFARDVLALEGGAHGGESSWRWPGILRRLKIPGPGELPGLDAQRDELLAQREDLLGGGTLDVPGCAVQAEERAPGLVEFEL